MAAGIRKVDLGPFLNPFAPLQEKEKSVMVLKEACETQGLFLLTGHGIPTDHGMFEAARRFFAVEPEVKGSMKIHKGGFTRGWVPIYGESGRKDLLEHKEAFSYGYPWEEGKSPLNPLQGENVWPAETLLDETWRKHLTDFFLTMCQIASALCRAFSLAIGKEEDYFHHFCQGGETISLMRIFRYLPLATVEESKDMDTITGSSPHTDWGFLTLILQDSVGGLEFLDEQGRWTPVPAVEGALVVNCGDYLSLMTNGCLKSPIHRVVPSASERISYVFFYYPSYDAAFPLEGADESSSTSTSKKTEEKYNTLLDLISSTSSDGRERALETEGKSMDSIPVSFGAYLMKKWGGVQS